jgi:hypothetical protein
LKNCQITSKTSKWPIKVPPICIALFQQLEESKEVNENINIIFLNRVCFITEILAIEVAIGFCLPSEIFF